MAAHPYRIVNVFTLPEGGLTGNPLCVFEDAAAMSGELMQALALQFNLSETTFILPPEAAHAAKVRIFTPGYEMPFAGHPTLGTAHVCRAMKLGGDALELELEAGVISVRASGDRWTLTAFEPTWREFDASREALAEALSLKITDIAERPLWVKAGKEQLIVPLTSTDAVTRVAPLVKGFEGIKSEDGHSMAYVFAFDGAARVTSRFFFPQGSAMLEDPATGSATANLGGWCRATGRALPVDLTISQGAQVGRPSRLYLSVSAAGRIEVGGDIVEVGRGAMTL